MRDIFTKDRYNSEGEEEKHKKKLLEKQSTLWRKNHSTQLIYPYLTTFYIYESKGEDHHGIEQRFVDWFHPHF